VEDGLAARIAEIESEFARKYGWDKPIGPSDPGRGGPGGSGGITPSPPPGTIDPAESAAPGQESTGDPAVEGPRNQTRSPYASQSSVYGESNRFYQKSAARAALNRLKQSLKQSGGRLSADQLQDLRDVAGYHLEAGSREFGAWTRRMLYDVGDAVIPYLQDLHGHGTLANSLSKILEREWKAGRISDELYNAMKLRSAK
jgi:hypothetical protein